MTADHQDTILVARVTAWLRLLVEPGTVAELRIPDYRSPRDTATSTRAGFFDSDHLERMAWEALYASQFAPGVYFTLNPLDQAVLRRGHTNSVGKANKQAQTADVLRRRWLFVDIDPMRDHPDGGQTSATDTEKGQALVRAHDIACWLKARGWSASLLVDSGNGYYLLFRVDLPAEDRGVTKRLLAALAGKFSDTVVTVDRRVFDPPRIAKVPGTWARKGDGMGDRPHRRSEIVGVLE